RVDQLREFDLREANLHHRRVPVHSHRVPAVEIPFGGGARDERLRRLRAVVHRHAGLEQRDLTAPGAQVEPGRLEARGGYGHRQGISETSESRPNTATASPP